MKEGPLVALVTLGLLLVLVAVVAGGVEDAGPITMARHFPVTAKDLAEAQRLAQDYRRCQLDYAHRNRAQYRVAALLADSAASVCAGHLEGVSQRLAAKGYAAAVVTRETRWVRDAEDRDTRPLVLALYGNR